MKRIKFILGSLLGTLSLLPALAFAQTAGNLNTTNGLGSTLTSLRSIMNMVVPILVGLGIIVFLYGVLKFIFYSNDPDKRKEGRSMMIWGIIGIAVMVSVWGLVGFLQSTFGINNPNQSVSYPVIP